ncbi:unnamed protein product [Clonostachys byssicola]|uniref:Uncharacterized protein n=1 Tax=Clonostachys byssicola TaxID=160290 RepID=A0A9N9XX16_9HYPO|nr:unnamed protein product [Clonostachys byssicola]
MQRTSMMSISRLNCSLVFQEKSHDFKMAVTSGHGQRRITNDIASVEDSSLFFPRKIHTFFIPFRGSLVTNRSYNSSLVFQKEFHNLEVAITGS